MINPDDCVTDLAKAMKTALGSTFKVYKYQRLETESPAEYAVVNSLPFAYGYPVNDKNFLNVNVHVKDTKSGDINSSRLNALVDIIFNALPPKPVQEEEWPTVINDCGYSIYSVSQPMYESSDKSHFVNVKVNIMFNELKLN